MEVTYHGGDCLRLRGRDAVVLVDPPSVGAAQKNRPDLVVRTTSRFVPELVAPGSGKVAEISGAGEFEVGGVIVYGIALGAGAAMCIEVDGVRVLAAGRIERMLTEEEVDRIGHVDVLAVPVSGPSANATNAARLASVIEPGVVIPVAFSTAPNDGLESIAHFAKEVGLPEGWTPQAKLAISGSTVGEDARTVVLESRPL